MAGNRRVNTTKTLQQRQCNKDSTKRDGESGSFGGQRIVDDLSVWSPKSVFGEYMKLRGSSSVPLCRCPDLENENDIVDHSIMCGPLFVLVHFSRFISFRCSGTFRCSTWCSSSCRRPQHDGARFVTGDGGFGLGPLGPLGPCSGSS